MNIIPKYDIERAINNPAPFYWAAHRPGNGKEEWGKDHRAFIIGMVLPVLDMPIKLRRIVVEAYLAGAEEISNGSSVVPESFRYGRTKDFQGVAHDYLFWLHEHGLPDAFGHYWTLDEANKAYRDLWIADGQKCRGWLWYVGLSIGSWYVWTKRGEK